MIELFVKQKPGFEGEDAGTSIPMKSSTPARPTRSSGFIAYPELNDDAFVRPNRESWLEAA